MRVRRALALDRAARLTFPCAFMGLTGRETESDALTLAFRDDATFRDARGELTLPALGVLVDSALGCVVRLKTEPAKRPATVHLQMQMTGASTRGDVAAHARFIAPSQGGGIRQSFSTATVEGGGTLIAHASAAFAIVDPEKGRIPMLRPWLPDGYAPETYDGGDIDDREREALASCERAEAAATAAVPFIEHFWCGVPESNGGKAHLSVDVTPHIGNTAGHVHGGVLVGIAARVANAAIPGDMRLSNISAWFASAGLGPRLDVRSSLLKSGRNIVLVHTRILGASGKLVLETTSQHVAAAG